MLYPKLYIFSVRGDVYLYAVVASRGHGGAFAPSLPPLEALPLLAPHFMVKIGHFWQNFWIFAPSETHFAPWMPPQKISGAATSGLYVAAFALNSIVFIMFNLPNVFGKLLMSVLVSYLNKQSEKVTNVKFTDLVCIHYLALYLIH